MDKNISLKCNKVHLTSKRGFLGDNDDTQVHAKPDGRKYNSISKDDNARETFDAENSYRGDYAKQKINSHLVSGAISQPADVAEQQNQKNNPIDQIIMQGKPYANLAVKQNLPCTKHTTKNNTLNHHHAPLVTDMEMTDGSGPQIYLDKPVIITAANTNKPIKLERRRDMSKKKDKLRISEKLKKGVAKKPDIIVHTENKELKEGKEVKSHDTLSSEQLTPDIGKSLEDRLKSFARMDIEFYDIINKMDEANDKRNLMPDEDEEFEQNELESGSMEKVINDKCIINIQTVDSEFEQLEMVTAIPSDNHFQNENNLVPFGIQAARSSVMSSISRGNSMQLSVSTTAKPISQVTSEKRITESCVDHPEDQANVRKNIDLNMCGKTPLVLTDMMIVGGSAFKEKHKHVDPLPVEIVDTDSHNERGGSRNDICDSSISCESISSLLRELRSTEALDIKEALRIMQIHATVSNEDIIHISGSRLPLEEKSLGFFTMKKDKNFSVQATTDANTIHQFCTSYQQGELDLHSKMISRYSHAPSQYVVLKPKEIRQLGVSQFEVSDTVVNVSNVNSPDILLKDKTEEVSLPVNEEDKKLSEIAIKIMKDIEESQDVNNKKLMKLQHVIDQIIEPDDSLNSGIIGQKLEIKNDESRYFQTPCPPKFNITPQVITNTLAPQYVSVLANENNISEENVQEEVEGDIEECVVYERMSADEKAYKERIVYRRHNSAMDIFECDKCTDSDGSDDDEAIKQDYGDRFVSVLDMRRKYKKNRPGSAFSFLDVKDDKPIFERSMSQPNFILRNNVKNPILSDYNSIMDETLQQCEQLKNIKADPLMYDGSQLDWRRTVDGEQWENVIRKEEMLYRNVEILSRSKSVEALDNYSDYYSEMLHKSCSENDLPQLNKEVTERYKVVNIELNTWLKEEFWYKWFDELFPPNDFEDVSLSRESLISSNTSDGLAQQIEVLPKNDSDSYNLIQDEIDLLSKKINNMSSSSGLLGFHLCRRGACYRKVGELKNALDDLNRAIELEPKLSDAYWHRHLVFLIQENTRKALEDLNRITMYNPNHTGAHRSRAEIYKQKGESNLAIFSYNQAIGSDPKNPELYYARAELLEQRGELLLAVDDYRSADMYEPENTSAIKKIGMYHFDHGLWMIAVNDFTELLKKQSKNAEAYMFRGRAWANLGKFAEAISDLSVSITLQPNSFVPFYYRGCYLRKCMPKQALQDLSVSLLLDSTVANVNSFLHRGILYMEIKRFDQATCDFQQAVRLNPHLAAAHVNLGVIEMKHNQNIHLAVKRFNVALRMDPTYIRAVICRAEAAEKVNNINGAILDYTRAIHMKPDSIDLRMTRGRLLLKKNQLDLASFHIRQCAVMNDGKNASPTQKAAVETFLKNYSNAISVLESAVKSQPVVHLFGLLGRTRMKAKEFRNAINDFNRALKLLKPWDPRLSWPKESAKIFFLIGVCYMELNENKSALDSFNISLKTNPTFAEGYFKRGLVKMKLGISKGVHDFNKALAYRPEFYQAYLGRAAYYGISKRYAKAIMNCNEAIKIEKESIRAFLYRGAIKFNIKAYALAIKDLSQAIQMDCTCSLAYFNRAVCFHEKKYYFHALKDYSIVLMTDDWNLHMKALLNRGLLYFQIGDMENAVHDFVLALKADHENPKIHHTLGLCYHRLGHLQKSIQSYTNALKVDPFFSNALLGRGNVLMNYNQKLGNLLGKRDYIRALHMNPLCMEARVNLAYSLQMQGYFKKAWNLFTRTIEINPGYKAALEGRALVNLQMSNTFGAFVDMNNAIMISKTAESLTLRGVVNQFLGDTMSAMNDYQTAKNLDPTYSLAYYNAANLYFLHRQLSQAISYYTKAIDWNPNDGAAILNRAVAKFINKDYESALDDFTIVEKLCPHWSHLYFNRGYLHSLNENNELAEDDYTRALIIQPDDALLYKKRADARGKSGKKELALKDYRRSIHLQMIQKTR